MRQKLLRLRVLVKGCVEKKMGGIVGMTEMRYHELLGRLLDDALSEAEADELRSGLESEPSRLRDLREHLVLWELWAQEQAPSRGAEAFCRGFQAQLQAEVAAAGVVDAQAAPPRPTDAPRPRRRFGAWPFGLACAAGIVLALAFAALRPRPGPEDDPALSPAIQLVSVRGEAVCARCILHLAKHCQAAIRVREGWPDELLLVRSGDDASDRLLRPWDAATRRSRSAPGAGSSTTTAARCSRRRGWRSPSNDEAPTSGAVPTESRPHPFESST